MHNYSISIRFHSYTKKNGTRQLYLYANINKCRPPARLPLSIYCLPSNFDLKKEIIVNDDLKNSVIESQKLKALTLFQNARYLDRPLTKERFIFLMKNEGIGQDFVEWMRKTMLKEAPNYELGTFKSWRKTHNKLMQFKSELPLHELDLKFVKEWDKWLKMQKCTTGKNKGKFLAHNTIAGHHKRLAKFIKIAILDLELNIKDPYQNFSAQYIEGNRDFLTPKELEKMVKLYDLREELELPHHLRETLRQFLFMVGSGLRISDSGKLQGLNIKENTIRIRMQKTKRYKLDSRFPLSSFSKKYINEIEGRIFKYKDCQTLNSNLKVICQYLNISKDITSHCARHTFATTFLIAKGRVEVLQKLLGHSDIKTTMIYVHITQETEREQIKLLDAFLDFD